MKHTETKLHTETKHADENFKQQQNNSKGIPTQQLSNSKQSFTQLNVLKKFQAATKYSNESSIQLNNYHAKLHTAKKTNLHNSDIFSFKLLLGVNNTSTVKRCIVLQCPRLF